MERGKQDKYTRVNNDWTKETKVTAPISSVQLSLEDGAICELSVLSDLANEDPTCIKQNYPKKLIEVLRAKLAIAQGFTGKNITKGPNQYGFTRTFLDGEVLRIFDLKSTKLRHKTVANLIIIMTHVIAYFGPKECLSNQKRYINYKI